MSSQYSPIEGVQHVGTGQHEWHQQRREAEDGENGDVSDQQHGGMRPAPLYVAMPHYQAHTSTLPTPYETMPMGMPPLSSHPEDVSDYLSASNHGQSIPPPQMASHPNAFPLESPTEWQSHPPKNARRGARQAALRGSNHTAKTTRQQFTACGACRHRRVKCDLKDRQDEFERLAVTESEGTGPRRGKQKRIQCSNCLERRLNCIDEFAPMKAAKQLRRGKRITEIEQLYGRSTADYVVSDSSTSRSSSKPPRNTHTLIPELTRDFFESSFFKRFQVQRPIIDPHDFIAKYLSQKMPTAAAMGAEGSILCHILYAWAVSYGVDENGHLDVPEGGGEPLQGISMYSAGEVESRREADRVRRKEEMKVVLDIILKEIDDCGILRKPSWDEIQTPVERLTMYEAALSQVFTLRSFTALNDDGQPSSASSVHEGDSSDYNMSIVRLRVYWYAFVHEGITTGLKGGRLHLDDEDLETIQESIDNSALIRDSAAFRISSQFATAPINLALACRKINKALTGPAARRRTAIDADLVKDAWEALEKCWEDFDELLSSILVDKPSAIYGDEISRFADGWKIFLFEAQNVIRNNLEARFNRLSNNPTRIARITESNSSPSTGSPQIMQDDLFTVCRLLEISKSKVEVKTKQIVELVKKHVGTRFFEWDASLVRDGTYYAAMWLVKDGGSEDDIAVCIQALNEIRWAHAKSWERSVELRSAWEKRNSASNSQEAEKWESVVTELERLGEEPPVESTRVPEQMQVEDAMVSGVDSSNSFSGSAPLSQPAYHQPTYISDGQAQHQVHHHQASLYQIHSTGREYSNPHYLYYQHDQSQSHPFPPSPHQLHFYSHHIPPSPHPVHHHNEPTLAVMQDNRFPICNLTSSAESSYTSPLIVSPLADTGVNTSLELPMNYSQPGAENYPNVRDPDMYHSQGIVPEVHDEYLHRLHPHPVEMKNARDGANMNSIPEVYAEYNNQEGEYTSEPYAQSGANHSIYDSNI
nr:hypothetical protein L203_02975 [Cryptococcus depauperatus CBS 7841]